MTVQELDMEINKLIDQLSPTWEVTPQSLADAKAKALAIANCAGQLGYEGCWLRDTAEEIRPEKPELDADLLRAKLACLSVTVACHD